VALIACGRRFVAVVHDDSFIHLSSAPAGVRAKGAARRRSTDRFETITVWARVATVIATTSRSQQKSTLGRIE
jgi:hypothetical protein